MSQYLFIIAVSHSFQTNPLWTAFVLYLFFGVGFMGTGTVIWMSERCKRNPLSDCRFKCTRLIGLFFAPVWWILFGIYTFFSKVVFANTRD